jgi:hypothetical protein
MRYARPALLPAASLWTTNDTVSAHPRVLLPLPLLLLRTASRVALTGCWRGSSGVSGVGDAKCTVTGREAGEEQAPLVVLHATTFTVTFADVCCALPLATTRSARVACPGR